MHTRLEDHDNSKNMFMLAIYYMNVLIIVSSKDLRFDAKFYYK